MYHVFVSIFVLSLGAAGLEQLKASDQNPYSKWAATLQGLSQTFFDGGDPVDLTRTRPEAEHPKDEMLQTLVDDEGPLVKGTETAPSSSLISSKRITDASSPLKADMDLVTPLSGINMEWGNFRKKSAPPVAPKRRASMIKQSSSSSTVDFPMAQQAQASMNKATNYLSSFSWNEYSDVASGRIKVRPQMIHQVKVEDKLDQSKLQGALADFLSVEKTVGVHEQQQEQQQPDEKVWQEQQQELQRLAMDN
eukprot:gnl/MRDRNA2_/MRDRNA2_174351_c0_seq1.p1 gnl/MRDRNA2_/MRDRNA2_174351_c0~~gnl/MRDRNA2_/MRDRNA2_174351_c0_seq1.p1  ORF type:complete len:250 (+),score=61.49 gnl/MRDRNA2_/MRDRNA2_174351_c0_seq1:103-852(+)